MKTLLNDLLLYELIMLGLGAFLFIILSSALVYMIVKKDEIKKLLLFFIVPIVMIGYPSIKEFKISADKVEFSRYQKEYAENPESEELKEKLEELTSRLEERLKSPEDLVMLSKAKVLLAKPEEAIILADKALKEIEEERKIEQPTTAIPSKNIKKVNPTIARAIQLKGLATLQKKTIESKDTVDLSKKINRIKLIDPELLKSKKVIQRNTIKKIELKDPKILFRDSKLTK